MPPPPQKLPGNFTKPGGKPGNKPKPGDKPPEKANPKEQQEIVAEAARGLEELRLIFEQYFMGNERVPPAEKRANYVGMLRRLKEGGLIRHTVAKFQLNNLWSKYQTYDQMWNRILSQIEAGTYKRDKFKVGLRNKQVGQPDAPQAQPVEELELEELDFNVEEVEHMPAAAPAAMPPPVRAPVPAAAPAPQPMAARPAGVPGVAPAAAPRPAGVPGVPAAAPAPGSALAGFMQRTGVAGAPGAPAAAPAMRPAATPGVPGQAPRPAPSMGPVVSQPPRPAAAPNAAMPRPAAAAAPAPAAARPPGDISDDYLRRIERTLSETRRKIGDSTETNFDTLKAQLSKQVPLIKQQHGAKSVEFQVVVKDGKALLKAIPKK